MDLELERAALQSLVSKRKRVATGGIVANPPMSEAEKEEMRARWLDDLDVTIESLTSKLNAVD